MRRNDPRWFPGFLVLAVVVTAGCSGSKGPCDGRTWACDEVDPGTVGGASGAISVGGAGIVAGTGGASVVTPVGSCESFVPAAFADLRENPKLPDPFLFPNGSRMTSKDQWSCRRAEIGAQAQEYELGPKPAAPDSVTGAMDGSNLVVTITVGAVTKSFSAAISYPNEGTPPYPAMIGMGGISIGPSELKAQGVATITFPNDVVAAQVNSGSRGTGIFYELHGRTHKAGALMAWAWGIGRLVDALEKTPDAQIDPARLGVTGCSRNGKGALMAGAFEERIVLTVPQESGSGGSACWRVSDAMKAGGENVQTLSQITGENVWFTSSFSRFGSAAKKLPFDHHMLEGLVAPRALLVIENTSQQWLGNVSTYTCSMAAHKIWEAIGLPDKMGVSQVDHPNHCEWISAQQPELNAYVQKYLVGGGSADTNVLKTDGGYKFDETAWIDWSVPVLQ